MGEIKTSAASFFLSVVIASYNAGQTIAKTLASLRSQRFAGGYEVIVVDSSTDDTASRIRRRFPEVRLFTFDERKFPGDARNYGITQSRGEIIAFIDADCIADPDWIAAIVRAHADPHPVIGGAVANANPESLVGWAYYFCEFSQWMPNFPRREMPEIPTCCLSITREAFDKYGPFLEGTYCSDSAFNWKVAKDGYRARYEPSILVSHINITQLRRFIAHAPFHGESFARIRSREQGFSPGKRRLYAALTPALPILLFARTIRRLWRNPTYLRPFLKAMPLVFAGLCAWSWGEYRGYRRGSKHP